ncbi:MAG: NAD(P)-binding protein [bacterium]|nr:NAD(P)-binding protein [bacterium]
MPQLTIDGIDVTAADGATVMDAAAQVGIEIPALCHVDGLRPLTSCMLCVVEDTGTGQTIPSCATRAEDGMVIQTNSDAIHAARQEVLQMLLSEHVGDCEAPCRRICPASLDVPLMMRKVSTGDLAGAARLAKRTLVFPATLGWVCSAPCERGCHRGAFDESLAIRDVHRRLAEDAALMEGVVAEARAASSGKRVAIVGAGVAGLSAAWELLLRGHACRIYEKDSRPGGPLRDLDDDELPWAVFEAEVAHILELGAELRVNCEVGEDMPLENLIGEFDAALLACDDLDDDLDDDHGVFEAVEFPMAVSAVAEGREMADEVDRFLRGVDEADSQKPFDCRLGEIGDHEKAAFAGHRANPGTVPHGRYAENLEDEARRCLHCDCLKVASCKLRRYATEYGAKQNSYAGVDRPSVEKASVSETVVYEPGKCVRCGLCVEITRKAGEPLGMAFVGRGFDVRVQVPFGRSLAEGLTVSARECVEACPTGALAWRGKEDRDQ